MKACTSKISPESISTCSNRSEGKETEYHTSLCRRAAGLLVGALLSGTLWGMGTHAASVTVLSGGDPALLAWLCGIVSSVTPLLFWLFEWGRSSQTSSSWRSLGPHSLTPLLVIKRISPSSALSLLAMLLYLLALRSLPSLEVAALYSCHKCLCYLLVWTILREQFSGVKVVSVICCMAGVVMMSYAEQYTDEALIGRILALAAAALTALNEVLFRLLIGHLSWQEMGTFLGVSGLCHVLLLWWVPLTGHLQKDDQYTSMGATPPWDYMWGTTVLFFCFQFLDKVGSHFLPASGISLGVFLSIAVSSVLNQPWEMPSRENLLGISAIGVGFLLLLMPQDWEERMGLIPTEQSQMEDVIDASQSRGSIPGI